MSHSYDPLSGINEQTLFTVIFMRNLWDYVECPADFRAIIFGVHWDNDTSCVKVTNRNIGGSGPFVVKAMDEILSGH